MNLASPASACMLEAPAKVNLTLNVLGKRDDGYHELETVMHQIGLTDKISLKRGGSGIQVSSTALWFLRMKKTWPIKPPG